MVFYMRSSVCWNLPLVALFTLGFSCSILNFLDFGEIIASFSFKFSALPGLCFWLLLASNERSISEGIDLLNAFPCGLALFESTLWRLCLPKLLLWIDVSSREGVPLSRISLWLGDFLFGEPWVWKVLRVLITSFEKFDFIFDSSSRIVEVSSLIKGFRLVES